MKRNGVMASSTTMASWLIRGVAVGTWLLVACGPAGGAAGSSAPAKPAAPAAAAPAAAPAGGQPAAAPAKPAGQPAASAEWDKIVEEARKEGEVIVWGESGQAGREFEKDAFEKAYPGIRVNLFQAPLSSDRDTR